MKRIASKALRHSGTEVDPSQFHSVAPHNVACALVPSPVYSRGRDRMGAFFMEDGMYAKGPLPSPPPEYRERE